MVAATLTGAPSPATSRLSPVAAATAPVTPREKTPPRSLHDLSALSIDRVRTPLSRWRGKVLLIVNTASACGFTPQYEGLEVLWNKYRAQGLAVLGFPSNDFDHQEPGTEAEIKRFCSLKYHVTFPMFAKIATHGPKQSPVYRFLTAKHGEPIWNFHKYLVGKDGQVIRAFEPGVQPDDPALLKAIDDALRG